MDCGPACLAMIAKYFGSNPDIEQIRHNCALGRDGVSLLGISKAAEDIGLKTVSGYLPFHILASEAPLPCIVYWNQNHFVVVYKIKKHRKEKYTICVADPGKGFVNYNRDEFCSHWTSTKTKGEEKGIVLLLEATEQFYVRREKKRGTENKPYKISLEIFKEIQTLLYTTDFGIVVWFTLTACLSIFNTSYC